ncbi:hypothetical protein Ahy_A03g010707 isoform D [Arachis hypogaea]|uniref:Protein kinase domain-containing protein n=1 Tax=Arachis hypogaea TaxID=3818 RepID=A0A445DN97_ARAHY|nr:hypothetical protein Ahy_A03g010707 isoform D [Arachis hypogaea]
MKSFRTSLYNAFNDYRFMQHSSGGMNYLHECKPEPVLHCDLKPKNILLDNGGQLKIAGFGNVRLSHISPDKAKLAEPVSNIDLLSVYLAPEIYKDEVFDRSVDAYSFGLILYEMIEGVQPFHHHSADEALRMMCLEGNRPPFKVKAKHYPPDLKELIEECWDREPVVRPTFSQEINNRGGSTTEHKRRKTEVPSSDTICEAHIDV